MKVKDFDEITKSIEKDIYIMKRTTIENIVEFNRFAINQKTFISCNFFITGIMHRRILPAHFCTSLINKFQPTTQHEIKVKHAL
jgi:hypothetical protein